MKRIIILVGMLLAAVGCVDVNVPSPEASQKPYSRVLILYSAGFNNLSSYLREDIRDMIASGQEGYVPPVGSNRAFVVVTHSTSGTRTTISSGYGPATSPYVIQVSRDRLGNPVLDTLLTLPKTSLLIDKDVMKTALNFIHERFQSDSYGMVMSSHGTGWLPDGFYANESESGGYITWSVGDDTEEDSWPDGIPVKTFGQEVLKNEAGKNEAFEMDIRDLAAGIPYKMDYILMDACLMGGIETAYELRGCTKLLGFSQAEVAADGFVYETLAKRLLLDCPASPMDVCRDYYERCAASTSSVMRSATISLIDLDMLEPLATVCRDLFETYRTPMSKLNRRSVQGFFRYDKHWFYDLEDILVQAGISSADHARLTAALNGCVVYKASTDRVLDDFDVRTFCGLSMYLPCAGSTFLDSYYSGLGWNRATDLVK